jgi:putative SOS response-associated peptidase YedK
MCGRFTSLLTPDLLAAIFDILAPPPLPPRYNIAPTQPAAVVRSGDEGHSRLDLLRWGLVPSWAKEISIGSHLINARCETVHEKPAFRHAARYRRCIIPASGFYEWQDTGGRKQPWYLRARDNAPFGLAGLWESWLMPDGTPLESFCILTTAANDLMRPIHDRMPVILPPEEYPRWLNHNQHDPRQLEELYRPYPADLMTAVKVSTAVNSPAHDAPDCLQPLAVDAVEG